MESTSINVDLLLELARYQAWADREHWKALHQNSALVEDSEMRKRLNHMVQATRRLTGLAQGAAMNLTPIPDIETPVELEAAMNNAHLAIVDAIQTVDLETTLALPRGPKGPFDAPAGVLLLQAIMHSQHHRGQNASRMRQLGAAPPMTDFVIWYALGRP
jgi:uncharacterized damage-inducible protein DinB